jgi:hypothetical protein
MARQAYQLEQQIHAFVRNPGQWRYLVQTQAMRMGGQLGGKLGNVNPLILNAANLAVLSQGRLSAAQALNRAAAISNLTNENASLGSILSLQAAQATVAEQTIQAQMDIETQLNVYLKRGSGLGGQAAKIQNWEMK